MQTYKYKGTVHYVGKTQTFPSGFAKRTLVLKEPDESKYPNYAAFEFTRSKDGLRDGTATLDNLCVGQTVVVTFAPQANESQKIAGSWFSSNRAIKIDFESEVQTPEIPFKDSEAEDLGDDMPF